MMLEDLKSSLNRLIIDLSPIDRDARERLEVLGQGLWSEDDEQQKLVHLDLNAVVSPSSIEERAYAHYQRMPKWLHWLDFLRNVLILLPIAVTWHALSAATSNYKKLIEEQPDLITQPFLLLWEQGFDGNANLFNPTFSQIASFDFFVISIIVLLTFFVHFQHDVRDSQAAEQAGVIRRRVEQIIWQINRLLAPERFRQAQAHAVLKVAEIADSFQINARDLLSHLASERERLDDLTKRREADLAQLTNFSSSLGEGTERILNYGRLVDEHTRKFHMVLAHLSSNVERLEQSQVHIVDALRSVEGSADILRQSTAMTNRDLDSALDELRNSTLENTASQQVLLEGIKKMSETGRLISQVGDLVHQSLQDVEQSRQSMLTDMHQVLEKVTITANQVSQASSQLSEVGRQIYQSQERSNELANLINNFLEHQHHLIAEIHSVMSGFSSIKPLLSDLTKSEHPIEQTSSPSEFFSPRGLLGLGMVIMIAVILGTMITTFIQQAI
ncbi:methyl-accepting chemotaxis protein [Candidatus Chloroploca sp. M-50]|uniref:Methyl-accepting chemotaxis protein n=1 Tax=Candidatus Chloroploca mongolica TaxID=2528176 RepID=A0ABS4D4U0_9CHLR|nr:methyl-accepting chemotaxis protein [Candidatus Chloroploca mongolica]MBP1464456.1 methyl-accepting chemotaxis protein [Candidatus Chloroploca mongolica]